MPGRNPTVAADYAVTQLQDSIDLRQLHRYDRERYPFLLQSTATSNELGRFDILFAFPGESLVLGSAGDLSGHEASNGGGFLTTLDEWWLRERRDPGHQALPFTGGWFLYFGYELAQEIEPGLSLQPDTMMPAALAVRCPGAIIRDHQKQCCYLVLESAAGIDAGTVFADIASAEQGDPRGPANVAGNPEVREEGASPFLNAVITAKQHIADGDIYQANLSRGWSAHVADEVEALGIYESLCAANPGPFAGLVHWHDTDVISSSPERLLRINDGVVSTRPIAGTRPRSDDKDVDDGLSAELIAHPKERAEHVMLIDLERNDLGRVCKPGTVEVDEMMVIESYAHVHHIVSNVRGTLRDDTTPGECIRAVFPGGTITGCPKVRCMEIIADLESGPRGAYTGSFGYLNRDGSLDLNILIRTMVMRGNRITLRAGSGIVADSDPESELFETRAKAKGLIKALSQ